MNSNTLEFFVKMKDMASSGLVKLAKTAKTSLSTIAKDIDGVIQKNRRMADSFEATERKAKSMGNSFGGLGSSIKRYIGIAAVGAIALGSIKAAMNYGATEKSFGVLTGSASKGKDLAGSLNRLQQDTILGPEVFKAAQTMMGFGVATEDVVKKQKQIGDVAMGNADKFEALSLAFSQTTAAGRLMGQDLLQYVNAGFNPLSVISERWKEFGLKSKKSVGELKEMMEKGQISAAAVSKAFELATGVGGKYENMMAQIAETSYGKMQILSGQWENLKIQAGNALMPIAEQAMDAASSVMQWLNITKTAPELLMGERLEINSLVGSITSLNEGNEIRARLLDTLKNKYPDLFGNLDTEKTKNGELYEMLKNVNGEYEKSIALASKQLIADVAGKDIKSKLQYATALTSQASYMEQNKDKGDWFTVKQTLMPKYMTFSQNMEFANSMQTMDATGLRGEAAKAYKEAQELQKLKAQTEASMVSSYTNSGRGGGAFAATTAAKNTTTTAAGITGSPLITEGKGKKEKEKDSNSIAGGITGGGPRVININGVKFADNINLHAASGDAALNMAEEKMQEMYLRILNSGASVQ